MPKDVFVACTLIGSHSEAEGRYCFVQCLADYPLQIRNMLVAMYNSGMRKQFQHIFWPLSDDIINLLQEAINWRRGSSNRKVLDIGSKFIEFMCDCGEIFFREYNHDHGGRYYRPVEMDERLFNFHRELGHVIQYRKCKRVEHSRVGNNSLWQEWGPYKWK